MFPVAFWLGRQRPLCRVPVVAVAVCHVSASQVTCRVSRSCWECYRDLVAFSGSEGLRPLALLSSPFLPLPLFPSSPAVEGSLRRSGAVERPGARAERRRVRGARRRRPTDREGPFVGWFLRSKSGGDVQPVVFLVATGWPSRSPLRFSSGFCSEGGTLAVAFGVATGQSSRSTFWGSDDALVAFSPPCRLVAGQWPRLRSGLLTLNATGRYVAFRPDSPLSHCLSLCWFRSHVVVSGVRPQLGQAAVLRELVCFCGSSVSPFVGAEAGARLASRACGLRVPLSAASGGGLVVVVVTAFPHDVSNSIPRCQSVVAPACVVSRPRGVSRVLPRIALVASGGGSSQECSAFVSGYRCVALWFDFRSRVPVRGGTGVCGLLTSWGVQGPEWFCVWALDPMEV
ncbi:hypothetical protein Taro_026426 [Colocasia esculenta]|uniref:Uncharacterized protein n=1 Tax=Colocasia esculenta TaxID=4460 RepID=A0A843VKJ8_COLES|nr:hypothetical protein [Colocasia esculenta]